MVTFHAGRPFLEFTSDGRFVLYLADAEEDERFELFFVPLDGSREAKKLNGTLTSGGDVLPGFEVRSEPRDSFR